MPFLCYSWSLVQLVTIFVCLIWLPHYLLACPCSIQEILLETQEEREKQTLSEEENSDNNGIVLVACKDERSCMQLEDCITNNPQKV